MNLAHLWGALLDNLPFMLVLLPLVGAGLVLASARLGADTVRRSALANVLLTLLLAALMVGHYDPGRRTRQGAPDTVQMESRLRWTAERAVGPEEGRETLVGPDVRIAVGVDGLSLWPAALVVLLTFSATLVGWDDDLSRPELFHAALLALESSLVATFVARDVVLFCIASEASLLLIFLFVGSWGRAERRPAARKFLLHNLTGSLLVILGVTALVAAQAWMGSPFLRPGDHSRVTFDIAELLNGPRGVSRLVAADAGAAQFWSTAGPWVATTLLTGFAIRAALVPSHTWLADLLSEAPASAGIFVICGALLTGLYGLVRFVVPLTSFSPGGDTWLIGLLVAGGLYAALTALAQDDLCRTLAALTVALLSLCAAGAFSGDPVGIAGSLLSAVATAPALLILLIVAAGLRGRYGTSDVAAFGGLAKCFPRMGAVLMFAALAILGMPGLGPFAGRVTAMLGLYRGGTSPPGGGHPTEAFWALAALLLVAWGMLRLVERVARGTFREPAFAPDLRRRTPVPRDLDARECLALAPLATVVLALGLWPQFFMSRTEPTVRELLNLPAAERTDAGGSR